MSAELISSQLADFLSFKNGKSSPDRNDEAENPVYGSNGLIGYADEVNAGQQTIIIGRVGSYCGSIHYSHQQCWVTDNAIACSSKSPKDSLFWYYYLIHANLNQFRSGSGQPLLNQSTLNSIPCHVPKDEDTRSLIGEFLSEFDKKIQLNHQINQTLEQMAQAIFKSWFVDFEPVKAKIAALEAGGSEEDALLAAMQAISGKDADQLARMQAEQPEQYAELRATAELFPSTMQDSELGEIPEGWMAPKFDELVTAKQGKYLAKDKMAESQSDDNPIPVWGGNGILGYTKEASYQNPIVLMTCRGSNCGLIRHTASGAWVSNNSFGCIPKMGSTWFLLTYFQASSFDDCVSGSAQPQITYSALKSKHLSYAVDPAVCRRYSDLIAPLYKQLLHNMEENSVLERLRDTLLPKLLSGELSIHQVMEDAKNE